MHLRDCALEMRTVFFWLLLTNVMSAACASRGEIAKVLKKTKRMCLSLLGSRQIQLSDDAPELTSQS